LYITDDVSPNPFSCNVGNSKVVIEILDDSTGELDEIVDVFAGPAFNEETQNLWISYCSSLGIPYEIFFDLIDWFARNTSTKQCE
jgi:hypothetical protein